MLERTRTRPTEFVELTFLVPADKAAAAKKAMSRFLPQEGKREQVEDKESDSIPWRECFPEYGPEDYPAVAIRGLRYRDGLTQRDLAERIGVPQRHISEMENRKRPIGKAMAKRLAKAFNVGYRIFL